MKRYYSIKDLAIESGVSYHAVYHYIRKGLLSEVGIIGEDQRLFDEVCLARLREILTFREAGKSIGEIQEILAERA